MNFRNSSSHVELVTFLYNAEFRIRQPLQPLNIAHTDDTCADVNLKAYVYWLSLLSASPATSLCPKHGLTISRQTDMSIMRLDFFVRCAQNERKRINVTLNANVVLKVRSLEPSATGTIVSRPVSRSKEAIYTCAIARRELRIQGATEDCRRHLCRVD